MLSKKSQYAIYAMVKLAKEYNNGVVLAQTISETEHIPRKFLETILLELKNRGFIGSKKGKGGGYYLIKSPESINLADIIRTFDGALALLPCVTYNYYEKCNHCKDENTCGTRSVIKQLRDETVKILKGSTLSDIIKREEKLLEAVPIVEEK